MRNSSGEAAVKKLLATAVIVATTLAGCNIADPSGSEIILSNRSFRTINAVFITSCDNPSWGSNRLKSGAVISPNANQKFPIEEGCYDLRAESTDQTFVEFNAVEVSSKTTYTLTVTN